MILTIKIHAMSNTFVKTLKDIYFKTFFLLLASLSFCITAKAGGTDGGIDDLPHVVRFTGTQTSNPAGYLAPLQNSFIDYFSYGVQSTQVSKKIKNIITFKINEETDKFISQDFTAIISVKIEYGHNSSSLNTITQSFTVDYKKAEGAKYNARQYFSLDDAEYVKITIQSINAPVIGSLDTRDILVLENEMRVTRYFELPATVPAPLSFNYTSPVDPVPDHLTVNWSWPLNTGNNATQLEWAWVENEMESYYFVNGSLSYDLLFKNSTRVDLPYNKLSFDIPLLYDGIGKLYYRIRAVNIKAAGSRSDGPWVTPANYAFSGHNNNLNWQAITSFADDGKCKTVIQYFDGSLRIRQTVTKDNTTNTVIAAESFYDGQGRKAIQILPTPGISTVMQYQANLNLFNGQAPNQDPAEIFDMEPIATPGSFTPALLTSSGASRYYSPANPEINTGVNKSIPDAEGYPYSVTRYVSDASGKVMTQSGTGFTHRMGSKHETKYYYGSPSQEELDGLFGTEVGNFTHYSKNMAKDANGQMSINYVDVNGHTIATALAGDAPGNLLPVNNPAQYVNQAGTLISRDLLDNSSNTVKGNSIESVNSLLVPALTNYAFRYELSPQILQLAACNGANPATLCYDCLYDLEITITDETGETPPIIRRFSNVSLNPDDNCSTPIEAFKDLGNNNVSNIITFNQSLDPGSYSIRKTLSISESSFQYYKDLYMTKAVCKTEQQIIDSIYSVLLSTSNCAADTVPITCQSCSTSLGTEPAYRAAYLISIGLNPAVTATAQIENDVHAAYIQAQQNCNRLCSNTSQSLPTIREMMLSDMAPYGGQYAKEDATENTTGSVHTMFDKYNIFSTVSPATQPFYKYPWNTSKVKDFYYDDANSRDITIHPEVAPAVNYTFLNNTSQAGFEQLFKNSWATSLLPHHPEYDRLVFAETFLTPSYNWINSFMQADYPTASGSNDYIHPVAHDPYFVQNSADANAMNNAISNYQNMGVGMWQLAYGDVRCKSIMDVTQRKNCYLAAPNTPPPYATFTAAENEQAWQIFRGLYAAERNNYVNIYIANSRPLSPASDEDDLIAQNFRLWFPRNNQQSASQNQWTWWPTSQGGGPVGVDPSGNPPTYTDRCSSYIARWKTQLLQCAALAGNPNKDAILDAITSRMQVVCVNGSNPANPYGASNVAPGTPATVTDRSFEDVIKNVFIQYGIINANGIYTDNYCNPFVIDWPKPYGKGPKMVGGEMIGQLEGCNCKQYTIVANDAAAHGVDITNLTLLNQYLLAQYGDTITPGLFAALQHCSEMTHIVCTTRDTTIAYNCNEPPPQCPQGRVASKAKLVGKQKPPVLNGSEFPCDVLDGVIVSFHKIYGYPQGVDCQKMFTEYFNSYFGTSYTWDEIAQIYLEACGHPLNVCDVFTYDCKTFTALIQEFHDLYGYPSGTECQNLFVEFFNHHFGTAFTWDDIARMYTEACGGSLNVCGGSTYNCKELQALIQEFHDIYGYPQFECQDLFMQFFNNHYGTHYTWNEIVAIYLDSCGIILDVCGPLFDCTELQSLLLQFHNIYGYPTGGECQTLFVAFFNSHFGTNYTWKQIVKIYFNSCGIVLDVCTPQICYVTCTITVCDTTYTPYILAQPQPMPDFLKCGYVNNPHCISCAGLSTLTGEYKTIFTPQVNTAPIFTGTNLTPVQVQYNMNYARFINYRTGYQFSWLDYSKAAALATPACNLANYNNNGSALQNVICGDTRPMADTIRITKDSPCIKVYTMAVTLGQQIYQIRLQALLQQFDAGYKAKCLAAKDIEKFTVDYTTSEYHYTLYYYDMAGNLVKTVPPKGVRPNFDKTYTDQVELDKANGVSNPRPHVLVTQYRYNSLNKVIEQNTPDGGTTKFWYDKLGRLVVSQNAQQAIENNFSYTVFDYVGRIKEVGQKPQAANSMNQGVSQNPTALNTWLNSSGGVKNQITRTTYDILATNVNPPPVLAPLTQQNLRNRVSYVQLFDVDPVADPSFNHQNATYYTYDINGNVDKLLQDYRGIAGMNNNGARFKILAYDYDLISGKVNLVSYQQDMPDAFYHKYNYDANNRLTDVFTSRDKIVWEKEAGYTYYKHGPLARTELGQLRVQGMDNAFTIQGWIKGMNNTSLNPSIDIAGDGSSQTTVAKDVLSYALHYYDEVVNGNSYIDYKPIGATNLFARPGSSSNLTSLYNGNIAALSVNNAGLAKNTVNTNSLPLLYNYRHDQLNRIVSMQVYKGLDLANNQWNSIALTDYQEAISYDPNGNIISYNRKGAPAAGRPLEMDNLTYNYAPNTNQLKQVRDAVGSTNYTEDIDDQSDPNNYTYDRIGNIISDAAEGITNITWTLYGKIKTITRANGTVNYTYDAAGNRISKTFNNVTTVYTRDAAGNTMALYQSTSAAAPVLTESYLYGSSRLGIATQLTVQAQVVTLAIGFTNGKLSTFTRGEKIFEISNHLNNVLATISDKKIAVSNDGTTISFYTADIISANDFYPFGLDMPGRNYGQSPRYGFNGKERDKDLLSITAYDYGFRIYNPAIGRFLSTDPLTASYPFYTPYQFAGNKPVGFIDLDGAEEAILPKEKFINVFLFPSMSSMADFSEHGNLAMIPGYQQALKQNLAGNAIYPISASSPEAALDRILFLKSQGYVINNIVIDSHGDNGNSFAIGGTKFDAVAAGSAPILQDITKGMVGSIVILGCEVGMNKQLVSGLAANTGHSVLANRAWSTDWPGMFNDKSTSKEQITEIVTLIYENSQEFRDKVAKQHGFWGRLFYGRKGRIRNTVNEIYKEGISPSGTFDIWANDYSPESPHPHWNAVTKRTLYEQRLGVWVTSDGGGYSILVPGAVMFDKNGNVKFQEKAFVNTIIGMILQALTEARFSTKLNPKPNE